jgi:hypothetical protein
LCKCGAVYFFRLLVLLGERTNWEPPTDNLNQNF